MLVKVSSTSCCTFVFVLYHRRSTRRWLVGTLEFGNGDRSFLRAKAQPCCPAPTQKTDSALTSNRILSSSRDAGTRGCVYHQDARTALMTASLRYARRHPDTRPWAQLVRFSNVAESLWRYPVNQGYLPPSHHRRPR